MNVRGAIVQQSPTRSNTIIGAVGVPGAIGVLAEEVATETPRTLSIQKNSRRSTESEEFKNVLASFNAIKQTAGIKQIIEEL